jgi:heat-inducible transcriptional repressor
LGARQPTGATAATEALSQRAEAVLRAIILEFIRTGEPIASGAVSRTARVDVSPATIRVLMGELTEKGLLEQPHTSAGRVPTRAALEHYVARMMRTRTPSPKARRALSEAIRHPGGSPAEVVRAASRHLAQHCILTALANRPSIQRALIHRLDLVRIDGGAAPGERVLTVLQLADGSVRQQVVTLDGAVDPTALERTRNLFNEQYAGRTLLDARDALRERLEADERARADGLHQPALVIADRLLESDQAAEEALIVEGRTHLLTQADEGAVAAFVRALDDKRRLLAVLDRLAREDGTQVLFGGGSSDGGLDGCTVVGAAYGASGTALGTVALIGPIRIDYARVVPLVGYAAKVISGVLDETDEAA